MAVLKVLIESRRPLALRDIAAATGMEPSNVHRYLASFKDAGMVSQDPLSSKYDIGPLAIELGLAALSRLDGIDVGTEVMDRLVQSLEIDGHLCVWGSAGATVIRWRAGGPEIAVRVAEGTVLPLLSSATGRTWWAFGQSSQVKRAEAREAERIAARTGATAAAVLKDLEPQLAEIVATGVSSSSSERREGIDALCAPVFDRAGVMALSITLLSPTAGFDPRPEGLPVGRLRAAVEEISRRLGCGAVELSRYPWRG